MANYGNVGTVKVVNEVDSVGPVKHLRVSVVGDGAYATGGSTGLVKALRNLLKDNVNVLHAVGAGTNKLSTQVENFEYTPRGALIDIDCATDVTPSTDLLSTGAVLHGLSAGNAVRLFVKKPHNANHPDAVMPGGLAEDTIYYVIASGLTTTAFKLSLTSGGAAIDVTTTGLGLIQVQSEDLLLTRKATDGTEDTTADQSAMTFNLYVVGY